MSVEMRTLETATYQAMGRNLRLCIAIKDHLVVSGLIDRIKMIGYIQEYKMFLKNSAQQHDNQRVALLQQMLKCVSQGSQDQQQAYFRTALIRRFRFELERNQWLQTMVGSVEMWLYKLRSDRQPMPRCLTAGIPKDLHRYLQYETQESQPLTVLCRLLREHCNLNTDAEYRRNDFCLYLEDAGAATYDELVAINQAPPFYFPDRIYPYNEARVHLDAALKMPPLTSVVPEARRPDGSSNKREPAPVVPVTSKMPTATSQTYKSHASVTQHITQLAQSSFKSEQPAAASVRFQDINGHLTSQNSRGPINLLNVPVSNCSYSPNSGYLADDEEEVYVPLYDVRDKLCDSFWEAVPELAREAEEEKKANLAAKKIEAAQKADVEATANGYTMGVAWGPETAASQSLNLLHQYSADDRAASWQSKRADQTVIQSGHTRDSVKRSIAPVTKPVVDLTAFEIFGNDTSPVRKNRKRHLEHECRETDGHVDKFSRETSQPAKRHKVMVGLEEKKRRVTSWLKEEFQGLKKPATSGKTSPTHRHTAASSAKSSTAGQSQKTQKASSTCSSGQVQPKKA